jgi:hypothetical protein
MKLLATIRSVKQFKNQTINILNKLNIKLWIIPAFIGSMVSFGIKFVLHLLSDDAQCSILTIDLFYYQELQRICHYFHASPAGKIWHAAQLLFSLIFSFIIINATTSLFHNRERKKNWLFRKSGHFCSYFGYFPLFLDIDTFKCPRTSYYP